jgi:hypothetical protein
MTIFDLPQGKNLALTNCSNSSAADVAEVRQLFVDFIKYWCYILFNRLYKRLNIIDFFSLVFMEPAL